MRDIKGYEGMYAVTSCGKVWSYKRNKFLHPWCDNGYLFVELCYFGQTKIYRVHRLVAEAYIENPSNYDTVHHIDENRKNNNVNNLQWLTLLDNIDRSRCRRKRIKCIETGIEYESINEAARQLGVFKENISAILKGRRKSIHGYHFEGVD